jgi:HAMP domain-containing protein
MTVAATRYLEGEARNLEEVARNLEAGAVGEDPEQVQLDVTHACVECSPRNFRTSAYNLEIGIGTEGHCE